MRMRPNLRREKISWKRLTVFTKHSEIMGPLTRHAEGSIRERERERERERVM